MGDRTTEIRRDGCANPGDDRPLSSTTSARIMYRLCSSVSKLVIATFASRGTAGARGARGAEGGAVATAGGGGDHSRCVVASTQYPSDSHHVDNEVLAQHNPPTTTSSNNQSHNHAARARHNDTQHRRIHHHCACHVRTRSPDNAGLELTNDETSTHTPPNRTRSSTKH